LATIRLSRGQMLRGKYWGVYYQLRKEQQELWWALSTVNGEIAEWQLENELYHVEDRICLILKALRTEPRRVLP
jgi:hypothetical protein